jgi:hydrogenase maturation protein HypF
LIGGDGREVPSPDPIASAAAAIAASAIVALKGLGGFHLACDATDAEVIARLRQRKRRDQKPFAVMVADIAGAERLALLDADERALLASPARPIVLARPRPASPLAAGVAPDAPLLGLMLPYTPLHHLLLHDAGRPLIMTSGNLADEPLAYRNDDARLRLAPLADCLLIHDRGIESFCDDSVARVIAGAPTLIRRSRGYVPRGVRISPPAPEPILACGALLKNTFCIAIGDTAYPGPHIGDLDNVASFDAYVEAIDRAQRFLRVTPQIVAHDLHPDYLSTRYAQSREAGGRIAVQHHHAHIASVMAEHGLPATVIGVAYDGTGYGTDGAAWGGEILLVRLDGFTRLATLRPMALAGGDAAIREPWRLAVALLDDAFGGSAPAHLIGRFGGVGIEQVEAVRRLIAGGQFAPPAHGAGRYFDAIGALVLGRSRSAFEGQIALAWNGIADLHERGSYPFEVDQGTAPWSIDLRSMVRAIVEDLATGQSAARISARFHNTLVEATARAVDVAAAAHGDLPVALSGGCFQNPRLAESLLARLSPRFDVYLNRRVPPGDGGIALGQAAIAAAIVEGP